jgi:hypothetical protein
VEIRLDQARAIRELHTTDLPIVRRSDQTGVSIR